jgi:hypothetical protein
MIFLILETKFSVSEPRSFGGTSIIKSQNLREIQLGFQWFYFLKVQLKGSIPAFSNTAIFSIE